MRLWLLFAARITDVCSGKVVWSPFSCGDAMMLMQGKDRWLGGRVSAKRVLQIVGSGDSAVMSNLMSRPFLVCVCNVQVATAV
jgi:hypothetical protein